MLLRFRSYNFSVVADLEKVFLQIVLDPRDRDYVRFLWFNNFDPGKKFEEQELIVLRVGRVLFGVTSLPCLLERTLIVHVETFSDVDPGFVKRLLDSLHVDDLISGCDTHEEVENFFLKCKERLKLASFNLKKFLEQTVYEKTGDDKTLTENVNPDDNKVLGVNWIYDSIYDPIGSINPVLVKLKCLFSRSFLQLHWDDSLSLDMPNKLAEFV